ncbi:MAG: helix-turn-helix domain-containing protein, partial [Lachnospiraceae bacterium]|nr:helix-turn-helix domain-containing protein [Lachnospiraceae bacterium]
MQIIEGDKYYTIPEVAEIIGVHIQSVRRWIKQEKLKAVKVSRNFFINADDVKKMVSVGKPKYQRKPVKPI